MNLARWPKVVELREKLNGKAKAQPDYRFYTLFDKVCRMDVLEAAYAHVKANQGAPGVDGQTFEDIAAYGEERYLAELAEELKGKRYKPQAVRRVMIEKEGQPGKFRPLGIPVIRDRVVQQAVRLVIEPIFEADLPAQAYGYRANRSALDAVREVVTALRSRHTEVLDADLSKYFDTIPHAALMRSVERRIADRQILWLIRKWLKVPVHERNKRGKVVITGGKKTKVGTPQGGVISPLLANIYFRRFVLAWERCGLGQKLQSRIVNYADDFVILTRGQAKAAHEATQRLIRGLKLTLNESKTRVVNAWKTPFNFLGYRFGQQYTWRGQPYLGCRPADKNVARYRERIRQCTHRSETLKTPDAMLTALNASTRGFWNYYRLGEGSKICHKLDRYLWERVRHWAKRKFKRSRRNARRTGQATRRRRIQAALKLLLKGRTVRQRYNGGPLFAGAVGLAQ
jgi:RNA-directed DNA polymerase